MSWFTSYCALWSIGKSNCWLVSSCSGAFSGIGDIDGVREGFVLLAFLESVNDVGAAWTGECALSVGDEAVELLSDVAIVVEGRCSE